MKKLVSAFLITALTGSLFAGCSHEASQIKTQTSQKKVNTYVPSKNSHIQQTFNQDIYGDQTKEKIVLYTEQDASGLPLAWSLVVNDVQKIKLSAEEGLYFFGEAKFADIDGDKRKEVLLYRQSSGSAGTRGLNIYKTSEQECQELFATPKPEQADDQRFNVQYLGNYIAHFEDKKTGLESTIPLDKNQYIGKENMLSGISTWIDPIADYSIVDHNGDGVQEIVTIQRIIGVAHVDTIGLLKTTYQLTNGKYRSVTLTLCDRNDKPLAEVKL